MASMNTTQRSSLSIALLAPLLAACAGSAASPALEQVQTQDVRALLPRLLDDAARRIGVEPALLRVARIEAVTWPDGALGCPQPGRLYPQALVPGWRIRIEAPFWKSQRITVKDEGIDLPFRGNGYTHQALEVARCLAEGRLESPRMSHAFSLSVMRTLDALRRPWGLRYPADG